MKRTILKSLVTAAVLGFVASPSWGAALGGYIELGGGSGEGEFDLPGDSSFDVDTGFFGGGFMLETSPLTKDKLFSYRIQIGLEGHNIEDDDDVTIELGGLIATNTFAFGGNTSENVRFWAGPQVLIGFYGGETDEEYLGDELEYSAGMFGLGIAGGANISVGSGNSILSLTGGFRRVAFSGEAEFLGETEDLDITATEFFFTAGFMFGR